jgi:transposase InsO family protein
VHIPGHGCWYAVTVIDYFSRYLLACRLTHSYSAAEVSHGLKLAREAAERIHGPLQFPPFLVTDNGPSFLARKFRAFLGGDYAHVRIPYRTPQQLWLLERFHGTLKKEEVYWQHYDSPQHIRECLARYRDQYDTARPHWALIPETGGDPLVPAEIFTDGREIRIPRWQPWAIAANAKLESAVLEDVA